MSCKMTRPTAGHVHTSGGQSGDRTTHQKAAGITCPSWSANRYDADSSGWRRPGRSELVVVPIGIATECQHCPDHQLHRSAPGRRGDGERRTVGRTDTGPTLLSVQVSARPQGHRARQAGVAQFEFPNRR